jgi:hypothetical protein
MKENFSVVVYRRDAVCRIRACVKEAPRGGRPVLSAVRRKAPNGRVECRWLRGRDASEEGVSRQTLLLQAA